MSLNLSDEEFITLWKTTGSPALMAKRTGSDIRQIYKRRKSIEAKFGIILDSTISKLVRSKAHVQKIGFRITENVTGHVPIFSDGHFWPGERSAAFDGFVNLIKLIKPKMVIANGDSFDGAKVSRHAPGGWASLPDVKDELAAVQERHAEIEAVAPEGCKLIWNCGNHDSRFTSKLAQNAPEYVGVHGTDITDHFPAWNFAWSTFLNNEVVVKHRHHSGIHAAYNNTLKGGRTTVTGHTHRLQVTAFGDYNGIRYGIECGTVSEFEPTSDKFAYGEDNPCNWSQGFVVLNFDDKGKMLEPEICRVINGRAYFRGKAL
jgi:predicted phosphodiesterase